MGLFDKSASCKKCGKPFTKGVLSTDKFCPDCSWENFITEQTAYSLRNQQEGITQYYKCMPKKFRDLPADINTIMAARDQKLKKYQKSVEMNITVLKNAALAFPEWSDEERIQFATKMLNCMLTTQNRMSFALGGFVLSHLFDGVAVDMDSVFAVSITKNNFYNANITEQPYLCALLTNDPYFPAIGMTFLPQTNKSFFALESSKNKERKEHLKEVLPQIFPNLTYPVMEMKEMKKLVKQEGAVRGGGMALDQMLALLDNADGPPFWSFESAMPEQLPTGIAMSIQQFGYVSLRDVYTWLNLQDKSVRAAWLPYLEEAAKQIEEFKGALRAYIMARNELI